MVLTLLPVMARIVAFTESATYRGTAVVSARPVGAKNVAG
jgi:hypothetical protein